MRSHLTTLECRRMEPPVLPAPLSDRTALLTGIEGELRHLIEELEAPPPSQNRSWDCAWRRRWGTSGRPEATWQSDNHSWKKRWREHPPPVCSSGPGRRRQHDEPRRLVGTQGDIQFPRCHWVVVG